MTENQWRTTLETEYIVVPYAMAARIHNIVNGHGEMA